MQDARDLLRRGDVVSDTFEILGLLGEGGMGQVYEARDLLLNRNVAIKVPWPHSKRSVRDEACALAALRHPSMVTIYGVWVHAAVEYAVMERIHGISLEAQIERGKATLSPFQVDEVLDILVGIADGLDVVHRAGIAHRDVKPANIMLAPGNRIVLMDFGIFESEIDRSKGKELNGSPCYMAPEVIAGSVAKGDLSLADTYALGIIAFELLTGDVPFSGDNVLKILHDQVTKPVPDLALLRPDAPPRLCMLVHQLLAKDPKERPESMDTVAWQLRKFRQACEAPPERLSVVIAEDNPSAAIVMEELIAEVAPNADIRVAVNGESALEIVQRKAPHLLIVDLNLPRISGVELCMYLHGTPAERRCTIVCVSAHAEPNDIELLRQMGCSEFITKGAELATRLPLIVKSVLERTRWGREETKESRGMSRHPPALSREGAATHPSLFPKRS